MQRNIVRLSIQAIGYWDATNHYPADPMLVGKNFDFYRGFYA